MIRNDRSLSQESSILASSHLTSAFPLRHHDLIARVQGLRTERKHAGRFQGDHKSPAILGSDQDNGG
jgi:hypothetical protein